MINFDVADFSERRSEEVISFFWRSVYFKIMWSCISTQYNENFPSAMNSVFIRQQKEHHYIL